MCGLWQWAMELLNCPWLEVVALKPIVLDKDSRKKPE